MNQKFISLAASIFIVSAYEKQAAVIGAIVVAAFVAIVWLVHKIRKP